MGLKPLCGAMKALLGRKLGMTRVFSPTGEVVPVTLIHAEPNIITLRRNSDRDGYAAVQLALPSTAGLKQHTAGEKHDEQKLTPTRLRELYATRREFSGTVADDASVLTVEQFSAGDVVDVSSTSKGKGFQGVVKRHGFAGGPASHGHRHVLRRPGSIGSRFPQHTVKGKRMAGRMGGERVTIKNTQIVLVDAAKHLLAIKGAVPGRRGAVVSVCAVHEA